MDEAYATRRLVRQWGSKLYVSVCVCVGGFAILSPIYQI